MSRPWKDTLNLPEAFHAPVRIAIMLFLLSNPRTKFSIIEKTLELTPGNLSSHLKKLSEGGFIEIEKVFINNKPTTLVHITIQGISSIKEYAKILNSAVNLDGK